MNPAQTRSWSSIVPILLAGCCAIIQAGLLAAGGIPDNKVWPRPALIPVPVATAGVKQPVKSLGGKWKLTLDAPENFWSDAVDTTAWRDVVVPRQGSTQGVPAGSNRPYVYRTRFSVPGDFAGKRIFLRFEGVAGQTSVWVNGVYVRDYFGGLTAWSCDITDRVSAGKEASLTVSVSDLPKRDQVRREALSTFRSDEVSPFNHGDILRDVLLIAVPADPISRFHVETDLDKSYKDAVLRVWIGMTFHQGGNGQVRLALKDGRGRLVPVKPDTLELSREKPEALVEIPVASPLKWDAEHPNLYSIEANLVAGNAVLQTLSRKVGFRKIEKSGRKLLVNGQEVKLRGVNRHEVYPLTGRTITAEQCDQDARMLAAANVNFVRTSYYPPSQAFLDACDRYGLYVEDEVPLDFATNDWYVDYPGVQQNPAYTPHFLNQFADMIERDRSHASVIIWSLGNESDWGRNIQRMADYARAEDPSRPIIFSWGSKAQFGTEAPYDIYSLHYAYYDSDPAAMSDMWTGTFTNNSNGKNFPIAARKEVEKNLPILHDEFAHIPSYDWHEQMRDPGVRNFWGETIKRFWESLFQRDGALGGAVWAAIDDYVVTPEGPASRNSWGLMDGWRREKPEYWLVKKAYSPLRIDEKPLSRPAQGSPLYIPVKNWFNHSNLSELRVAWSVGKSAGTLQGPNVPPRAGGSLRLPGRDWKDGEVVGLKFYRGDLMVDEYNLALNPVASSLPQLDGPAPRVQEERDRIVLSGAEFSLTFSRQTGLITSGTYRGTEIIESGPYLQLEGLSLPEWTLKHMQVVRESSYAVVSLSGNYGQVAVCFELKVDGRGLIVTKYVLDSMPLLPPMPKARVSMSSDVGGYGEVGVSFVLTSKVDRLAWQRKGLWSAYPESHIGRNAGIASRYGKGESERYGVVPSWPWSQDERDFSLYGRYDVGGRGTNDFRSMKENIFYASASVCDTENGIRAESDGKHAVRLEVLDDPLAMVDDRDPKVRLVGSWSHLDDDAGNYSGTNSLSAQAGDYAELEFSGTGIVWLGSKDRFHGMADVYIDGKFEAARIDSWSGGNMDMPMGQDAQPRQPLFSKEGLDDARHIIKVVVTGKRNPLSEGAFVSVDAFKVLGGKSKGRVRFIISNEWNYPEVGAYVWGNYARDAVVVGTGYTNEVRLRFANDK